MAVSNFQRKLKSLLESEAICETDFVTYIALLDDLSKLMDNENEFPIYAKVVKNWLSGFTTIFSDKKTKNCAREFWETYTSKSCPNVTTTLFTVLQCFRQFEPNYTQEFYLHWKTIASRMDGLKRADTFYSLADKFKIVVQHLRTAASRTEQFAIMSVLRLYIECVPVTQLYRLHEHDNAEIVKMVGGFMENPSTLNLHKFLDDINAMGHCIESLHPTKIVCRKLNIDMDDTNYSMWFDFNKMEQSVNFATVSLADNANQCFATARRVKLRESVKDSHLLEINGIWHVISMGNIHSSGQRVTIRVYFVNKTKELISTAVRTVYRFVNSGGVTGSVSQGFISDHTEAEPAQDESQVSPETAPRLNDSFLSVVPPKLISTGGNESKFSLPTPTKLRQDVQRWNSSLPLLPRARHDSDESDAELPIKSNMTYVIKTSVESVGNGTPADHSPSSDPNATYVLRESVNPIANEQPEYDDDSETDNSDNGMVIECPLMELDNESVASNGTYTICIGARSPTLTEANRLADQDMVLDEDDSQYGDACASKKIEIIENIMIVPPRAQPQSEPTQNISVASRQNVEYLHLSQMDVSVNRKVFNQYSQPTTSREWFYVKDSSFRSRNIRHFGSNESIQRSSQRPIVVAQVKIANLDNSDGRDDQSDRSVQSDRKESPVTATTKRNTSSHDDCPFNASNGVTHRSQAVSPWPIEFSGHYESFSPIDTSTQRSQVRLRNVSYSKQTSQLSPDPKMSSPTEQHSAGSSFQKSFCQNSMTLTGSSQERSQSVKANKSLNQTEVLPRATGTSDTPLTIDKKIECNAGIESSSLQASREKSSENLSQNPAAPKRTECIAIAELPEISQLHIGPAAESQREPKASQNESKVKQQFTSSQSSTEKSAPSSLQQSVEVPTVDPLAKSSKTDLNSSAQRTKSPSLQIMPISAPQHNQDSKELKTAEGTEHSWQKKTATSSQQSSQIPTVPRNSTEIPPALPLVAQRVDDDFTVELPDDVDCFQTMPNLLQSQAKMSEPQTESTAEKITARATISSDNPKASMAVQPKKTAARKIAKNSVKNKAKSTNATTKLLSPHVLRKMSTATLPLRLSKPAPRYSSLTKPTTLNSKRNSQHLQTIRFDEADVPDLSDEADENSSNDGVNTDGIRVDENGTVYDDNGCVFANNDELQRAAKFYIANDGLNFLKKETVTVLPASKRQKYERRLRTIQRMIDRGLERLRVGPESATELDPYAETIAETTIQGEKRKRRFKEVSVTTSSKTYVDNANQITYSQRTSKMHYVFDEGTSTGSKSTMSKAMSKSKTFSKAKTAQAFKAPRPPSVNLTEGMAKSRQNGITSNPSNRPVAEPSSNRLEVDRTPMVSMNEDCAEADTSATSRKMLAAHQQKMATKTTCQPLQHHDESPSTTINCSGNASTNGKAMTGDELCSTAKCAGNMKELLDNLNGIEMDSCHTCRGSCEQNQNTLKTFIDRLSRKEFQDQDHGVSDWQQSFNCLLESLESMCKTASDQLQVHEGESYGQVI